MNNLELLTNREVYKPNKVMAIDLDDTVLDLNGSLIEFHNLKYGTSLKYEDIDSFDLAKIWGCTHEESIRRIEEFLNSNKELKLIEGAFDAIFSLRNKYQLYIVTARPDFIEDSTIGNISSYFSEDTFENIFFTNHFYDKSRKKSEICRNINADIFIDDSVNNVLDVYQNVGIKTFLMDRPWNHSIKNLPNEIERVFSWSDILEKSL